LTQSGRRAVTDLLDEYTRKVRKHPGCFPVVLLKTGIGRSKKHNSTYDVPVFRIVDWRPWDPEPAQPDVPVENISLGDEITF
jgi:hypothetical protein